MRTISKMTVILGLALVVQACDGDGDGGAMGAAGTRTRSGTGAAGTGASSTTGWTGDTRDSGTTGASGGPGNMGAAGTGGGGASEAGGRAAELARFTGTWHAVSGTETTACPDLPVDTAPITGNISWEEGVSSDLVQSYALCIINADVSGLTASGSGPPCTFTDRGATATWTVSSYTFVLSADGRTAQENQSGTLVVNSGGATATCTVSASASYLKIGK